MEGINDAWQLIDSTAQGAANYVKKQLENVLVKYLTELAEKQFVLPIFAQLTNTSAGAVGQNSFSTLNAVNSLFGGGAAAGAGVYAGAAGEGAVLTGEAVSGYTVAAGAGAAGLGGA